MATAEPVVKEKKKSRLRGRFLLSQAASLDGAMGGTNLITGTSDYSIVTFSVDRFGLPFNYDDNVGVDATKKGNGTYSSSESHDCHSAENGSTSRMRRILFRRSRSEDRMRNLRVKASHNTGDGPGASLATSDNFPSLVAAAATPATLVIDNPAAEALDPIRPNLDHIPHSPPPPYEVSSESRETGRMVSSLSPPSYDEAMGQNTPVEQPRITPTLYWTNHDQRMANLDYCSCIECQTRNLTLDEEEQEDNCSDAVFPMETHVLMQEVLADGMAFCTLM